ncbi:MAG: peptidoglycan DD-metalloendopeptidase family protein [Clostridiales Family XIII bacterium]|jgi:murein DD-endopeptidase MepM/ murein hydrolase activator NlpD|nr:peptidoglycan DD-metalloendopeptidase family protein [Clostridiales Family XIII bacterium]
MFKKLLCFAMSAILCVMLVYAAPPSVHAEKSVDDLQEELDRAKAESNQAKATYEQAKKSEQGIQAKIRGLEASIKSTEAELIGLEKEIAENNILVDRITADVVRMEGEVASQDNDLNARLRLMYMSRDMSLIEVLLNSENILDFLNNLDMVKRIHKYDVEVLEELNRKLNEVESKKAELVKIQSMLDAHKNAQEAKRASLAEDKKSLASAQEEAHATTVAAKAEMDNIEAESRKIEQELRNRESQTTYGGGVLSWPVTGRISSGFGYRVSPTTGRRQLHAGIDIPASTGTPIHAAADGQVISAGWNNGGYGYMVMVDHGSGIVTVYAHNSSVAVSGGQQVTRGQTIAYAGSTGDSTGPHCHFEVRVYGTPQDPLKWL